MLRLQGAHDSMVHTLRPAQERLTTNVQLTSNATLSRALFNVLNEQPSTVESPLPTVEEELPTNVVLAEEELPTNVVVTNPERVSSRAARVEAIDDSDEEEVTEEMMAVQAVDEVANAEPREVAEEETANGTEAALPSTAVLDATPTDMYRTGTMRDTLRTLVLSANTIAREGVVVENYRLVLRDMEREKEFRPMPKVMDIAEDEKNAKLKVRRMIHHLKDDPDNHLHSDIILDFMSDRNVACVWYVLQNVATDLSGGGWTRA